jgi:O-6-methylguanine DNA methyltransferase
MEHSLILPKSLVGALEVKSDGEFITELNFAKDKFENFSLSEDAEFSSQKKDKDKMYYIFNLPSSKTQLENGRQDFLNIPDPLIKAFKWLSLYFLGEIPQNMPPLKASGTAFQLEVYGELLKIPYGKTASYGELAKNIAKKRNGRMSARAVGGAAGSNPIPIFIPCHRLIGADGSLTSFSSGLDIKIKLLQLEKDGLSKKTV